MYVRGWRTSGGDDVGRADGHGLLLILLAVSGALDSSRRQLLRKRTLKVAFWDWPAATAGADMMATCSLFQGCSGWGAGAALV